MNRIIVRRMPFAAGLALLMSHGSLSPQDIPKDKRLDAAYVRSLMEKGTQRVYKGAELNTIGMPCGGIAAGQIYVRGDGTLAKWLLWDNGKDDGEWGLKSYARAAVRPESPIPCTFTLTVTPKGGAAVAIPLDQTGYNAIEFIGEYPVARIKYVNTPKKSAVEATLTVFSPFIPLNAKDSAIPATILKYSLANTSAAPVTADVKGTLSNPNAKNSVLLNVLVPGGSPKGSADATVTLNAGEKKDVSFVLAWHCRADRFNYNNWFSSASDVASYVSTHYERLYNQTMLFHDTYFNTTLPYWFVQRIGMPVSTLATEVSQWWKSGRFWAWEGFKCCPGTCTHVYNYVQAIAHLFPELERSVRTMQDLTPGVGMNADGSIGMRAEKERKCAMDGQCGAVLKVYREHLMSADSAFLKSAWPATKKAMEYAVSHDPDANGIIVDTQWQTYDSSYQGANTFVGSLYLAALRAASEMAKLMNDGASAARYDQIFAKGKAWTEQNLFKNGYFIQIVQPGGTDSYGTGCLADQVFGQTWAGLYHLGDVYSQDKIQSALRSVWEYNWAPDVAAHPAPHARTYALKGEPGLFVLTFPFGGKTKMNYSDEVWTGIEYQVATCMIQQNMLKEAFAILHGIHKRYNGNNHNPWNEVECNEHYARAMASWGALLAVSDFLYDGPAGTIGFSPKLTPENFRSFFSGAQGWGSIAQVRSSGGQENGIEVKYGTLRVRKMVFDVPSGLQSAAFAVKLNDAPLKAAKALVGGKFTVTLSSDAVVKAGEKLTFAVGNAAGAKPAAPQD